jgi:hypothetical protein
VWKCGQNEVLIGPRSTRGTKVIHSEHQATGFTRNFVEIRKIELVVVMRAVDWWKNLPQPQLARVFKLPVQWIILRRRGKQSDQRRSNQFP